MVCSPTLHSTLLTLQLQLSPRAAPPEKAQGTREFTDHILAGEKCRLSLDGEKLILNQLLNEHQTYIYLAQFKQYLSTQKLK